jgi:hypothetical protein
MHSRSIWRAAAVALSATTVLGGATFASAATGQPGGAHHSGGVRHVLLISVDGLHQQDLAWYVRNHPHSALATLDHRGLEYGNAETPFPSDSFPGMVGQVTGGDPRVTGIYYDDTWTQIAPTILRLLSLNPDELQAVQIEHTRVLPGLRGGGGH